MLLRLGISNREQHITPCSRMLVTDATGSAGRMRRWRSLLNECVRTGTGTGNRRQRLLAQVGQGLASKQSTTGTSPRMALWSSNRAPGKKSEELHASGGGSAIGRCVPSCCLPGCRTKAEASEAHHERQCLVLSVQMRFNAMIMNTSLALLCEPSRARTADPRVTTCCAHGSTRRPLGSHPPRPA